MVVSRGQPPAPRPGAAGRPQTGRPHTGWTTDGIGVRDAFAAYREVISRTIVPLAAVPLTGQPFRASVEHLGDDDFQLSRVRATGQRVRRTPALIDRGLRGYTLVTIQLAGSSGVEQDRRSTELVPGSIVVCDSSRPFAFTFGAEFEQLVVQVPSARLLDRAGLTERAMRRATAVPLDPDGPASVVAGFFTSLTALSRRDPDGTGIFTEHAVGLLASVVAMAAGAGPSEPDAGELARVRVLEHLRGNFADQRLDAESVARACHLSRRALFRLFADSPLSLADELRRIRVEHVGRLLLTHPRRPVGELAAAAGFASETQLYRAFRSVVGTTPAAYRAAHHGSGGSGGGEDGGAGVGRRRRPGGVWQAWRP
ncbi:AraC family transcriptional regulator [Micromonospora sp. NPDC050397]|uniref:AraC family transcriptional regulator n=1 Tax=Micromonospora sp. NPDC050397 TaxID=3364279 RepID=UPI00384EAA52